MARIELKAGSFTVYWDGGDKWLSDDKDAGEIIESLTRAVPIQSTVLWPDLTAYLVSQLERIPTIKILAVDYSEPNNELPKGAIP
jgi:hypothetical protein